MGTIFLTITEGITYPTPAFARTGDRCAPLRWPAALRWLACAAALAAIYFLGARGEQVFIYFQF